MVYFCNNLKIPAYTYNEGEMYMGISKENVFKVEYTSVLGNTLKEKRISKIKKFIKTNKIISITVLVFVMCFSLNVIMIYNFMKILENI